MSATPSFTDLYGDISPDTVVRDAARAAQMLVVMCGTDPDRIRSVQNHELFAARLSLQSALAYLSSAVAAADAIDAFKTGGAA